MGIYVNPGNSGFAEIDDADYVNRGFCSFSGILSNYTNS